ncbi:hypothetical protein SAMN05892883_0372 [Jatrophihabitans sp. GAS493]|nr:hypothetical protein SAMN05892883_0372 [Jatrophihabitans sp. GAS493]
MSVEPMTAMLELPQLSGGRRRAAALVDAGHLPDDLSDASVTIDARQLLAGTESFADELVKILLLDRKAETLNVINVSDDFALFLEQAAKTHSVSRRLVVDRF